MRAVNIKELKARLSAYLREVDRGERLLVTDRGRVVARIEPPRPLGEREQQQPDWVARVASLGARPPLRARRPTDYRRAKIGQVLSIAQIDALLDWVRDERR